MQFLPVVQRELLVASRKRATYLSRSLTAGVLLAFFPSLLNLQQGPVGARLLQFLSVVVFLECLLAGVRYTADCLSEEKREGTLGLLFLTNLSGFDVVAGKMVAQAIPAIYNLVGAIPILAISVIAGGVTGAQIVSLSVALLAVVIFSLCAGAFISSRGYGERSVLVHTLFFLILAALLPILITDVSNRLFRLLTAGSPEPLPSVLSFAQSALAAVENLSPLHLFFASGPGFSRSLQPALWTILLLSVSMVAYASWRIRRQFGEPEKLSTKPRKANPSRTRPFIRPFTLDLHRLGGNPILWLALAHRSSRKLIFFLCAFVLCFGVFIRLALEHNWMWARPVVIFGSLSIHLLYKFLVTAETCRQLNQDKRSGALELLLTTPMPPREIVRAQLAATRRTWLPVGFCVAIMNFTWMTEHSFMRDMWILLPCSIALIFFDGYALTRRSVLNAIAGQHYIRTVCRTFFRIMIPPIVAIFVVITFCMGTAGRSETVQVIFGLWTFACIVFDLIVAADARRRLASFRSIAAGDEPWPRRPSTRPSSISFPAGRGLAHPA